MTLIDLSMAIEDGMPVYPGDAETRIEPLGGELGREGWTAHHIQMSLHAGTHVEAPAHSVPGGKVLSDYPLERFCGPATVIEWEEIGRRPLFTEILFVRTGFDRWWGEDRYFSPPSLTIEGARWIVEQGVKLVGFDIISVGGLEIHRALQEKDLLIVEMLRNLDAVLHRPLDVYLFPLRIPGKEASPIRAVAEVAS